MKIINIEGNEFIRCTAICEGRRNAMLIHTAEDTNGEHFFAVYFDDDSTDSLPEDAADVKNIFEEYLDTTSETLDTVLIDGKPISAFSWTSTKGDNQC